MTESASCRDDILSRGLSLVNADPNVRRGVQFDYAFIEHAVCEAAKQYQIHEIGYDPYNATDLVGRLSENHGLTMVEFRQGCLSMSDPSKTLERLVLSGRIRHGENPILRWMASHVSVATDPAGNIKPVKPDRNRGSKRIDGIVAAIMVIGREMLRDRTARSPCISIIELVY